MLGWILGITIFIINFMFLSKWMDLDTKDGVDIAFCCLFSLIGSIFVIPFAILFPIMKLITKKTIMPFFQGIFWCRDIISQKGGEIKKYIGESKENREMIRETNRQKKGMIKSLKKENIIRDLKKEIKILEVRNSELNKYNREDMIDL